MIEPRDYQVKALTAVAQAEKEGVRRPLVVHPTGTGKTVTFSALLSERADRGRGLILVHREELAEQAAEKIGWIAPGLKTGIVKAERNEWDADVVIASVPTISRGSRLEEMKEQGRIRPFGTVVADEAHHAPAPSWTAALTALGSFSPYGPLTVGFTATPERDNGKTLGVWEKVVSYMSIREAIYKGYLVPILPVEVIATKFDVTKVRKGTGETGYVESDVAKQLEESGALAKIADAYVEHASDRKGVAFTPNVKTAHLLAELLCARGIPAEAVDGETPKAERKAILARLRTGRTQVVTNCGVLTEGFDEPSISCVVIARAARFHGLYVQMVGRGTRNSPGKKDLLILDGVGASERHELVIEVDLGADLDDEARNKGDESERMQCPTCESPDCGFPEWHRCKLCNRYLPVKVTSSHGSFHDNCQAGGRKQRDVFGESRMRWLPVEQGWCLGAGKEVVLMTPIGVGNWRLSSYRNGKVDTLHDELPADWAMNIGEDRAKAFIKLAERKATWLSQPVSDLQKSALVREGLPVNRLHLVRTRGDAADLMTRIQGRRAYRKLTGQAR